MPDIGRNDEPIERLAAVRRLNKRRVASGTRCPKKLWLEVHEPDAPELAAAPIPTVLLEQGRKCGELARRHWPDGHLVGDGRIAAFDLDRAAADTRALIDAGTRVLFEATFVTDRTVAIVDVLERLDDGWRLIEVKQANACNDDHVADVAFQLHVLESSGLHVREAVVMHLNRECRAPILDDLFVTMDVTAEARAYAGTIAVTVASLSAMLDGAMPVGQIDVPCVSPDPCVFKPRCWSGMPEHHVSTLYMLRKKDAFAHHHAGRLSVMDLELPPPKRKPSATALVQWRQQEALQLGKRIVEREALAATMASLRYPIAMLDFETVQLAVPVWAGCSPHAQVPVQFSCHTIAAPGATAVHRAWLARTSDDPREAFALHVIEACRGAATVMAYHASFEQGCLTRLAEWLPGHADELMDIHHRLVDMLPIVREHVYDPAFGGSFSIKKVLPALVPHLSYQGLTIGKGDVAAAELYRIMFSGAEMPDSEREYVIEALLEYCRLDTEAMVQLHDTLIALSRDGAD